MDYKKRRIIKEIVDSIRNNLDIKIPLTEDKLIKIVEKLEGSIIIKNYEPLDFSAPEGYIEKNTQGTFTITINSNLPEKRKIFTIAHEIGHLFLHMGYLIDDEKWNNMDSYDYVYFREGRSETEWQANEFAAELLMPEELFREKIRENVDYNTNTCEIEPISNFFNVSDDAVITRGKFLREFSW